eukprot:GHVU01158906.1.p1 GENE.GHVU01158906.1~~GHVU01158906.1.p1  ORF type:complete len:199 (+),score=19.51 GHVU01158906.1:84-599(+)
MGIEVPVRRVHPALFGAILLFAFIEAVLSSWLTARFNKHHNYFSTSELDRTRFLVFTSWWTVIIGSVYLAFSLGAAATSVVGSVASHGIFLFVTWIFWLAGAAAITHTLGGSLNCSRELAVYCHQMNALEAFAWITWVFVTFALVLVAFRGYNSAKTGSGGVKGPMVETTV